MHREKQEDDGSPCAGPSAVGASTSSLVASVCGDLLVRQLAEAAAAWDMGVSKRAEPATAVVDVPRASLNGFLSDFEAAARRNSASLAISLGGLRLFPLRRLTRMRILYRIRRRAGYFRILVVSGNGVLLKVIECRVWDRGRSYWMTSDRKAPLRRYPIAAPGKSSGTQQGTRSFRSEFALAFPIDAVLTWVNSEDAEWRSLYTRFRALEDLDRDRFSQWDELRYAIRSVAQNAGWVRTIFVFSNCKPPAWFKRTDRVRWIFHSDVIPESYLPTFNSHVIETYLHHIPGIADNFIYFNDDFFLSDRSLPYDYFLFDGRSVSKFEPYGMVGFFALLDDSRAEWMSAAVNGARLLESRFGVFPTRLHEHAPYALRSRLLRQIEQEFPEAIEQTRSNRFRSHQDLSLTSFFYHHYAEINGLGTAATVSTFLVRPQNAKRFARRALGGRTYQSICINDGDGSAQNPAFNRFKRLFLDDVFPYASECEIRL